tara:strand:+ start:10669 stop:12465 length:1797 start_codon:yes stop_codon:yes gene_type:complete
MASITKIITQYEDYGLWYLKAYEVNTNSPKLIHFDKQKTQSFDKVRLDHDGFPISSGGAKFNLFIDGYYDLWLFPTEKEANQNDTSNAEVMAKNLSAEVLTAEDITVATESEVGVVQLASEQSIDEFNIGDPVSEKEVINIAKNDYQISQRIATQAEVEAGTAGRLIDAALLAANAGGAGGDVGDVVLKDVSIGDASDAVLKQDMMNFSEIDNPILATLPGYSRSAGVNSIGSIGTFTNPPTTASSVSRMVKISSSLYYRLVRISGNFYMQSSTDQGQNWSANLDESGMGTSDAIAIAWDGADNILCITSYYCSVFELSSETFISKNISTQLTGRLAQIVHWNENRGLWFVFATTTSTQGLAVSADGITWTSVATNLSNGSGAQFYGMSTAQGAHYYDGKYYFAGEQFRQVTSVDENDYSVSVLFNFSPTTTLTPFFGLRQLSVNKNGNMACIIASNSTNSMDIVISLDKGVTWSVIQYTSPSFLDISDSSAYVAPLEGDSWMIIPSKETDFFDITNDNFQTTLYSYGTTSDSTLVSGARGSIISDDEKIIVEMPNGTAVSDFKLVIVQYTQDSEYLTLDLSHLSENDGQLYPYVIRG